MRSQAQQGGHLPAEEGLAHVKLQRARRLESLAAMALGVAHDLNNVTACILGNNTILLRNLPAGSPLEENAQEVELAANGAADLAKQLTFFSGKAKANTVVLDLSELVRNMEPELSSMGASGVVFHFKPQHDLPMVKADPDQIRTVIRNLTQNAVDFLTGGKGSVTVRTGLIESVASVREDCYLDESLPSGRHAFLEVIDTGRGIAHAAMERIFEPFFTTKMRARGMGLSVAIGVIRAHRGAITVNSEPGHGATFRVILPCLT